jgi:uncharacterized protein (TIGR03032 family)
MMNQELVATPPLKASLDERPDPGQPEPEPAQESGPAPAPLRSVHSSSLPALLRKLGVSVLVTTYQAGKLVVLRAQPDGVLNTHFRNFKQPMGLALDGNRLAIGTALEIGEFHNVPAVAARRLEPAGQHDACFLPRCAHTTGNVLIHEMAWAGQELWFVNTRFSCLSRRSDLHSFAPHWKPPFVSSLSPEDRCHLNGLAVVDGAPRFVTALGRSDEPGGWRAHKKDGGVLLEVPSGEVVLAGLSMPHSPRWHQGQLWVLDSGTGGLGIVEPQGRYREVTRLPGFTRGLDFVGRLAFVGLSQVRESAVFSGIEIASRPVEERCCGVWVVDVITGGTVAFVRFEDAVQEVFAVTVVPRRFPDIINDDDKLIADSFVLPNEAAQEVPAALWSPANPQPSRMHPGRP